MPPNVSGKQGRSTCIAGGSGGTAPAQGPVASGSQPSDMSTERHGKRKAVGVDLEQAKRPSSRTKQSQQHDPRSSSPAALSPIEIPPSSVIVAEPPSPTRESLANLTCPICLGAPSPLAITICGHAFCAPCIHQSLSMAPKIIPEYVHQPNPIFFGRTTGRGGGRMGASGGRTMEPSDLDANCPVCRTPLLGGWGKSIRGIVLKIAPLNSE